MVKYARGRGRKGVAKRGRKVYVPKKSAPATLTGVKKLVNKMILKKAESKFKHADFGKIELYHNNMSVSQINEHASCMPTQGTGDSQRVGDNINVGGFYIRMLCGQKADRPNCVWKFYVLKVPKGTAVSYSTFFDAITNNVLLDTPNKDKVSVLKTLTMKPAKSTMFLANYGSSSGNNKEFTFPVKIWLPYRRVYKFQSDGGTPHNDGDLYLIKLVYDAYGTLTTDNIAYVQLISTVYYKDP